MPPNDPSTLPAHARREMLCLTGCVLLLLLYGTLATLANADLIAGRFALFMDERITFDGVRHILEAAGPREFVWSVTDGGDHRYGRSLWNSLALAAWLPAQVFGDPGQIFAARMAQTVFLFGAFTLLALTVARYWATRFLLLFCLLTLPFTDYYASMPKPEPQQLLCLALFLFVFRRRALAFRSPAWLFLGLAFGTKISTLPAALVFGFAALAQALHARGDADTLVRDMVAALGYFLLGLVLAVPILLSPALLAASLYLLVSALRHGRLGWAGRLVLVGVLVAGTLLTVWLKLRSNAYSPLMTWVGSTFLNTAHGADSSAVTPATWLAYFVEDWLQAPSAGALLVLVLCAAALALYGVRQIRARRIEAIWSLPVVVLAAGLALNMAIVLASHRLWGFYLFPGMVLTLAGLVAILEHELAPLLSAVAAERRRAVPAAAALAALLALALFAWLPHSLAAFRTLATRTASPAYQADLRAYEELTEFLSWYAGRLGRPVFVHFDPWLFLPDNTPAYRIREFWGPYTHWQANADVIAFSVQHTAQDAPIAAGSPGYDAFLAERDGYARFVISNGSSCLQQQCYLRVLTLANQGEVLVRVPATGAATRH